MKKTLTLLLALLLSLAPIALAGELEPVTFDVYYVEGSGLSPGDLKIIQDYAAAHADHNVTINWISLGDPSVMAERISILFSSGEYGDATWQNPLQEADVSVLSAQGILQPLNDLITKENTPNLYKLFETVPSTKIISTLPDGNFYTLPRYVGNRGDFLESPIWVNKVWLEKLGLDIPTTAAEFEAMLIAFRDGDPNGNGRADEIPMMIFDGDAFRHMEIWLGMFGIPTKSNNFDSCVYVKDGTVFFAPMQEAYKDCIKWLNSLYAQNLIYQDLFTTTLETVTAKMNGEEPVIGVVTTKTLPKFQDEYAQILPPAVEGYNTRWFYHPGSLGIKNFFSVTNACKEPARLLAYFDDMWTTEQTLRNSYGPVGDVLIQREDGTYGFQDPPGGISLGEYLMYNTMGVGMFVLYPEDYGTLFDISITDQLMWASYELYEPILNKEIWPRPFFTEGLAMRAAELRTDIFNTVNQKKAMWVTGQADIDAEWDAFQANLKKMGVEEFIGICQQAYDIFMANIK